MSLLDQIKDAGIVGCGGAGFPTHVKMNCEVEYLIINGAECEPLLRTDRWLMKHKAAEIITAAECIASQVKAEKAFIALKETYKEEIQCLRRAIDEKKSYIKVFELKNFYPAGDEQSIVLDVTGRTVPPAGIPLDVGAVVSNIATVFACYEALQGKTFTHKYLTVTGEVAHPIVLRVPIGTSFSACIEAAGGVTCRGDYRIIAGGPLMGKLMTEAEMLKTCVTKTTSGIIVIPEDTALVAQKETPLQTVIRRAKSVCIQCSRCTQMCPRYLSGHPLKPHKIMRSIAYADGVESILDNPVVRQAQICSECGVCETYACPMGLQPRKVNSLIKGELAKQRVRYERTQNFYEARQERAWTSVPSKRLATRLGVEAYYDYKIDELKEPEIRIVEIALKQHIGAPAEPVVSVGQEVKCGQLIAACPEKALGANIHASIDGVVIDINDSILIERR